MKIHDEGDKIQILMKKEKDSLRELLIVNYGKSDCSLIQIKGNFSVKEVNAILKAEL